MLNISGPETKIKTNVQLSGSKSISNRLLIIKEVLGLQTNIHHLSHSEDTQLLVKALNEININKTNVIDIGHAGSDMRFLTALLATKQGFWHLTGSDRMKQRPISELVNALRSLGADIQYSEQTGYPPLEIKGRVLKGGVLSINADVSSQFISALLLISPLFEQGLELHLKGAVVSRPYINMTVDILRAFGVNIETSENFIRVHPFDKLSKPPSTFSVESDWSSASYWFSICALSPGSGIELRFLNSKSLQADSVLPKLYEPLGVKTSFIEQTLVLSHTGTSLAHFDYDFTECPDIAQTLAVTCLGLGINTQLRGLSTLKLKETDRILALKNELEKFGAQVHVTSNTLSFESLVNDVKSISSISIDTYNDHRMAMSFAPLSLLCRPLIIKDPGVIDKSYPAFWEDLKSAGFNVNLQP